MDPSTGFVHQLWQAYLDSLSQAVTFNFAPVDAQYWLSTSAATLTNERNIGALASGYVKITVGAGIATPSSTATIPATDIAAGTAAINISGNAGTATVLQTARNINGVAFNGSAAITITASADTLTGTTLPALSGVNLTALNASNLASGTVPQARKWTEVTTVATGSNNNFAIAGDQLGANNAGALTLTGIVAGVAGQRLVILALNATVTLNNADGASTAANQIVTGTGGNVTLAAGVGTATLTYSAVDSRWHVLGTVT